MIGWEKEKGRELWVRGERGIGCASILVLTVLAAAWSAGSGSRARIDFVMAIVVFWGMFVYGVLATGRQQREILLLFAVVCAPLVALPCVRTTLDSQS